MFGFAARRASVASVRCLLSSTTKMSGGRAMSASSSVSDLYPVSERAKRIHGDLLKFMDERVYPAEKIYLEQLNSQDDRWQTPPIMEELKAEARRRGLWNLFLPSESGLSVLEYAMIAEVTGRSPHIAPEALNCSAPDTGNMEVLHMYGTEAQKKQWLEPLLDGRIRSCFCMTEPDVASSDATNMECRIVRDGSHYVINGKKWWSSGAGNNNCRLVILMGRTGSDADPRHLRHSMILVPLDTPGVVKVRPLLVYGYDDAPHGHFEVHFRDVRVPVENMLLGEGRGFEIAQGRLGPGRIHHCMRAIGLAEHALELMCRRSLDRVAFGKQLARQGVVQAEIARSRMEIEQARLLTLNAARAIDLHGNKAARREIAMIKVVAPNMACTVLDRAIQLHGGMGVSADTALAGFWAHTRTLRIADGPDEVHMAALARAELKPYAMAKL